MRKWFLPVVLTLLGSCIVFALVNSYRSRQASEAAEAEAPVLAAQFGYDSSQTIRELEICYEVFRSPCYYVMYYTTNLSQEEFRELANTSDFTINSESSAITQVGGLMMELQYQLQGDNIDALVYGQSWSLQSPTGRSLVVDFYNAADKEYKLGEEVLTHNIVKFMVLVE